MKTVLRSSFLAYLILPVALVCGLALGVAVTPSRALAEKQCESNICNMETTNCGMTTWQVNCQETSGGCSSYSC
jgi:hypothetical protein